MLVFEKFFSGWILLYKYKAPFKYYVIREGVPPFFEKMMTKVFFMMTEGVPPLTATVISGDTITWYDTVFENFNLYDKKII